MDYANLRDTTAANLIAQFGQVATLRKASAPGYNPATGVASSTPQDTVVRCIETALRMALKGHEAKGEFDAEQARFWDTGLLMSAKETAAAGIEPLVGDLVILASGSFKIAWILPVKPSGIAVIYKMALTK